jgi:hypothetical protein
MIERRSALGGIVVVPWQITAALDEERLARFDEMVRSAGLVVFGERPRRNGDPEGLFLERVRDRVALTAAEEGEAVDAEYVEEETGPEVSVVSAAAGTVLEDGEGAADGEEVGDPGGLFTDGLFDEEPLGDEDVTHAD